METIGERIKLLRKELNLTQVQLGEVIGISGAGVGKIETNASKPTEAALRLICSTYHVYYLWLTTGQGPMLEDDLVARIDRIVEKGAPNADAVFKAQVKAYAALMSDEDWIIFRDMVDQIRTANKE